MKSLFSKTAVLFCTLFFTTVTAYSQQGYQAISGTYYNNNSNTVMCGCNSQGLLSYVASDGNAYLMTLCFDTEPGSFYEIFDGENITVAGNVKSVPCNNGQSYLVLYVVKSQLQPLNRREMVPEFIKKQSSKPAPSPAKPKVAETSMEGNFMPKGSTKDTWSDYNHCNSCGMLNGNKSQPIIFDRISSMPDYGARIKVWGTKEGKSFYVTRWEQK